MYIASLLASLNLGFFLGYEEDMKQYIYSNYIY